jgi:hypothetical protein
VHPERPAGRYDDERTTSPILVWVAATVVAALAVGGLWLLYARHQSGSVEAALRSYDVQSDRRVQVTFEVRTGSAPARCAVRAKDRSGLETGYAVVDVKAGTTVVTYDLPTQARAVTAELLGCKRP